MVTRNERGFTLSEALIVVAIVGTVFMLAPRLIVNAVRFYNLHAAKIEIQRDARAGLDLINRFLRQAQASSVVIDELAGQPPHSRISFTTVQGTSMSFYQFGNQLYHSTGGTSNPISENLRYIAFTYPRSDDPTIISVAVTMEKATYQGASKALELSIEKVRVMN